MFFALLCSRHFYGCIHLNGLVVWNGRTITKRDVNKKSKTLTEASTFRRLPPTLAVRFKAISSTLRCWASTGYDRGDSCHTVCVCVCLAPWTQLGWQPGPTAQFGVKLDSLARTQLGGWGGGVMPRFKPSCCYSRCLSLLFNRTESQGWSLGGAGNMWLLELFLERRRGGLFIRCVPRSLCSAAPPTYDPPFTVQCIYHMINGKWTAFI